MNSTSRVSLRRRTVRPLWNPSAIKARRIRQFQFAVLGAIAALIPASGDVDGRASGLLSVADIASRASLSRKCVGRVLPFWRTWRVLWYAYRGKGIFEIRFERRVVVGLFAAQKVCPLEVKRLMLAHRQKRERIAPRQERDAISPATEISVPIASPEPSPVVP